MFKGYQSSLLTLATCGNIIMDREERLRRNIHVAIERHKSMQEATIYHVALIYTTQIHSVVFIYCIMIRAERYYVIYHNTRKLSVWCYLLDNNCDNFDTLLITILPRIMTGLIYCLVSLSSRGKEHCNKITYIIVLLASSAAIRIHCGYHRL